MLKGNCSLREFTIRLEQAISNGERNASSDSYTLPQREQINKAAETIAKKEGYWFPLEKALVLGTPMPSGVENEVYLNDKEKRVYKVNNLLTSQDILSLFHRLLLHNTYFPQTEYSLVGFTGFGEGSIYPILSQVFIQDATYATHGEILDYMECLGFHMVGDAAFSNNKIIISDLRPRNVLKRPTGSIFIVDANFEVIQH